jgi:Protein of unknown function (DUF2971)
MSRDYRYVAKVRAGQSEFAALFEAATKFAKGSDRWVEVQPGYMAFHFEAADALSKFCDYVASHVLQLIAPDDLAVRSEQKRQPSKARLAPQIEKVLAAFEDASNRRMTGANVANAPKEPLFHYTSEQALTSIVESEQFWFTSIYHMDDPTELKFGFSVFRSLLQKAIAAQGGLTRVFCQGLLEDDDLKIIEKHIAFYSISFGLKDDPQQWKSYADQGRGAALGLAAAFFRPAPFKDPNQSKPEEEIFYSKVSYGNVDARGRHSKVLDAAFGLIKQLQAAGWLRTKEEAGQFCHHLAASMYAEILWNCVTTKDSNWSHQIETRILARNFLKSPRLRIVNADKRPRLEITQPLLRTSIVEVMIGPNADPGAFTRMRKFLDALGLAGVLVTRAARR